MPAPARARTLALERTLRDDVTWRLLRADNAPLIVAMLGTHLGGEERRLPAAELYARIDADLEDLRSMGQDLPLTAKGYCADWRKAEFLVRRPSPNTREETFELSPAAAGAIRIVADLEAPRVHATESRLMSIASQLSRLATETDPDASRRLRELQAERDRIEATMARLADGDIEVLSAERAEERLADIIAQAAEVPTDFARVRAEFDELNRVLRQEILDSDASDRHVLDEVFRGVDLIEDSGAGRTFRAFSQLLLDEELGAAFDDDLERVIGQPFARALPATQRRLLQRFLRTLKHDNADINRALTGFARGLRRYVQTQEFQRDRELRNLLRTALTGGVATASSVRPWTPTEVTIDLPSVAMTSVGVFRLYDPADDLPAIVVVEENEPEVLDLDVLRAITRQTEIDFAELTRNVNAVVESSGSASVADILQEYPATQGVASVAGLLALAEAQFTADTDRSETAVWTGVDKVSRRAEIPYRVFERTIA